MVSAMVAGEFGTCTPAARNASTFSWAPPAPPEQAWRERMEALRQQFEPRREDMERLREGHLAEVRERMDALRAELQELSEERARALREERDEF